MTETPDPQAIRGLDANHWLGHIWALLPALLLATTVFWSGTFVSGATFAGATTTQLALLAFCWIGARQSPDPLILGLRGRWIVPLLFGALVASWWLSPVPRAGSVGILLLPALMLVPSAVARCWQRSNELAIGQAALSIVVLMVSAFAIASIWVVQTPRAALPLGHHSLLAGWLVLVLPAVVTTRVESRLVRGLVWAAAAIGLIALALTGSFLGAIVASGQFLALILVCRWPRRLILVLLVPAYGLAGRLAEITQGADASLRARSVYFEAGLAGILQRPLLGWGPGSTPWMISRFTAPVANLNPSTEIIGDLHSLPLQIGFEGGLVVLGLAALLVFWFLASRIRTIRADRDVSRVGPLVGMIGGVVFSLGSSPLAIPALPVTAAIVAGAALQGSWSPPRRARWLPLMYLSAAAILLLPKAWAHRHYDLARGQSDPAQTLVNLQSAIRLDPEFPLYRARAAWLQSAAEKSAPAANEARLAAEKAVAVAPLWLQAGYLGHRAGLVWAPDALAQAADLDPLSTLVWFQRMVTQPTDPQASDWGARALYGEPGFAQARFWRQHVDLAKAVALRSGVEPRTTPLDEKSDVVELAMVFDKTTAQSFSLFAFRRSAWPGALAPVEIVISAENDG